MPAATPHLPVLAVLQNMWDPDRAKRNKPAPVVFRISPDNHSGKKLYRVVNEQRFRLFVTNAASEVGAHAADHRTQADHSQLKQKKM